MLPGISAEIKNSTKFKPLFYKNSDQLPSSPKWYHKYMTQIVPTITAENPHIYREQIERVQAFASCLHIDLMDGIFTPNKSISATQVWWPDDIQADIHVMFKHPLEILEELIALKPRSIIIHAECSDDIAGIFEKLSQAGIRRGLALLPQTSTEDISQYLQAVDQILIFSGNLGHQGGSAVDFELLNKADELKKIQPSLQIAWDGGLSNANVSEVSSRGIEVLNVGGAIHGSDDPQKSYQRLQSLLA